MNRTLVFDTLEQATRFDDIELRALAASNIGEYYSREKWDDMRADQLAKLAANNDNSALMVKGFVKMLEDTPLYSVPDSMLDAIRVPSPALESSEQGLFCNTIDYFLGEENCMIDVISSPEEQKSVWLLLPIGTVRCVSNDMMQKRGVAMVKLIETLQSAGVSVGAIAYDCSVFRDYGNTIDTQAIILKHPEQAINLALISRVLCNNALAKGIFIPRSYLVHQGFGNSDLPDHARESIAKHINNNQFVEIAATTLDAVQDESTLSEVIAKTIKDCEKVIVKQNKQY